jgi:hypothetical protein
VHWLLCERVWYLTGMACGRAQHASVAFDLFSIGMLTYSDPTQGYLWQQCCVNVHVLCALSWNAPSHNNKSLSPRMACVSPQSLFQ